MGKTKGKPVTTDALVHLQAPLAALQRLIARLDNRGVIFKAIAHRPQDLLDIQAIIASQPRLDVQRIKYWVGEFAQALEMPELWADIAGWLHTIEEK